MNNLPSYDDYLILEKKWNRKIESSHLVNYKYDSETKILEIEFHNGAIYQYEDVPKDVFKDFSKETSVIGKIGGGIAKAAKKLFGKGEIDEGTYGTRFWETIRRGGYKYKRIN
jgi:uncharacterized protein YuzE